MAIVRVLPPSPRTIITRLIRAGINQKEIAVAAGTTQPSISRLYTKGKDDCQYSVVVNLWKFAQKKLPESDLNQGAE